MTTELRSMRRYIFIGAACSLLGSGLFVWQSIDARRQNCERVAEAFDAYTDALAKVTGAEAERVQEFRDAYQPALENCS